MSRGTPYERSGTSFSSNTYSLSASRFESTGRSGGDLSWAPYLVCFEGGLPPYEVNLRILVYLVIYDSGCLCPYTSIIGDI